MKRLLFGVCLCFWCVLSSLAPASAADDGRVRELKFPVLEETALFTTPDKLDITAFPGSILKLNGQKVRIAGHLLLRPDAGEVVGEFALSSTAGGGCFCCGLGQGPTIFNTVIVDLQEGAEMKAPFSPLVEATGTFEAKKEYYTDALGGARLSCLFYLHNATVKPKKGILWR